MSGVADDSHEVAVRLARIETKLDASLTTGTDHEARIRRLERVILMATGAAATGGGVAGALFSRLITH